MRYTSQTMKKVENNFKCYTYGKKGKTACSAHHIRECDLTQIVPDDLRGQPGMVSGNSRRTSIRRTVRSCGGR